jgi:hypothetical protein
VKPVLPVDKSGRCAWPVRSPYCIRRPRPSTRCSRVGAISNCAATWIMARSRGRCWMCSPRSNGATTDQQRTRLPMRTLDSPCLYLTAQSDSAEFTSNPDGVECPYRPANTAGSNMEGYRYVWRHGDRSAPFRRRRIIGDGRAILVPPGIGLQVTRSFHYCQGGLRHRLRGCQV